MKGFFLGVALASVGWVGGFYLYQARQQVAAKPEADVAQPEPGAGSKRQRKVRRRPVGAPREGAPEAEMGLAEEEPPARKLTAAEMRPASRGDDLSRADVLQLDMGAKDDAPELTEDEIERRFRERQDAILDCIDKSRPDDQTFVPGRVSIQFRIQRTGQVRGVRVEAPSILQQGGLYNCVKSVVMALRFPASNGSQVVTYPFSLN